MKVQDIRVNVINSDNGLKAIGSFSLDGQFAVRGVRVMEDGKGRNFVAFPAREKSNGEYEDVAFPLNKELYHDITEAVIAEYKKVLEEKQGKVESEDKSESNKQTEAEAVDTPKKKGKAR